MSIESRFSSTEAMEQVLLNESRIPPRITFLKPLSAAFAIGTGGPFGFSAGVYLVSDPPSTGTHRVDDLFDGRLDLSGRRQASDEDY